MTPDQEKKLNEVHAAIVGNESMGYKGLVSRMQEVEVYQAKDRKFKNKLAGGVLVGVPVLGVIVEWIKFKLL